MQPHRPACRSEAAPNLAERARTQVEVDLGKFEGAEEAARAHDRAAVWCLGLTAPTNFPIADSLRVRAPRWVAAAGGRRALRPCVYNIQLRTCRGARRRSLAGYSTAGQHCTFTSSAARLASAACLEHGRARAARAVSLRAGGGKRRGGALRAGRRRLLGGAGAWRRRRRGGGRRRRAAAGRGRAAGPGRRGRPARRRC